MAVQGQKSTEEEVQRQGEKANRSSSVEVLLVRSTEKVLDAVDGLLISTAWNCQLLDRQAGLRILQVIDAACADRVAMLCLARAMLVGSMHAGIHKS